MKIKKSGNVMLTGLFLAAIASCQPSSSNDWTSGADRYGRTRDTSINNNHYRYYGMGWYPIYNGLIAPHMYSPASVSEISSPGYSPIRATSTVSSSGIRTGGFGGTAHMSSGS